MSSAISYQTRGASTDRGTRALTRAQRIPVGTCVAVGLVGAYFARASLLAHVGTPSSMQLVSQLPIAALLMGTAYVLAGGVVRLRWSGVAMILAAGLSLLSCETRDFAGARWAGWSLMLLTVGPVSASLLAKNLRRRAADVMFATLLGATLLSAVWQIGRLPHLGVGDFSGVMWHSMTLGPLAALCAINALSRALSRPVGGWYAVYGVAAIVVLWASSRAALVAMVLGSAAMLALRMKRRPLVSAAVLAAAILIALIPDATLELGSRLLPEGLTAGLLRKSLNHSREAHWEARWQEFCYLPVTGIGFACGWEDTAGYSEETAAIETGSSYLSLLSMTGLVGAGAFALLVAPAALRTVRHWRWLSDGDRLEMVGVAGFWFVDLGAEGYVYGLGSVLSLAFWLWLGRVLDQLDAAAGMRARAQRVGPRGAG